MTTLRYTPRKDRMAAERALEDFEDRWRWRNDESLLPYPAERLWLRKQAGVSLRDVADVLGVSHTAVIKYEQRGHKPRDPSVFAEYRRLLLGFDSIIRAYP